MNRDRAECCGLFNVYDPEVQICCDGEVFDVEDKSKQCCGKEMYTAADQLCCENEVRWLKKMTVAVQ